MFSLYEIILALAFIIPVCGMSYWAGYDCRKREQNDLLQDIFSDIIADGSVSPDVFDRLTEEVKK